MSGTQLFLLAGGTGSGKSHFARHHPPSSHGIVVFDYDHLMYEAVPFAFPYYVGGEHRWTKGIWEVTKRFVDAKAAMLRAVRHLHKYQPAAQGPLTKALFYGYQLADSHWVDAARFIVENISGVSATVHVCWYHPAVETVIANRRKRDAPHDRISESEMERQHDKYAEAIGVRYDSRAATASDVLARVSGFFDVGGHLCEAERRAGRKVESSA